jgi:hypothetical protein
MKKLMVSDMYERGPKKGKVLLQQTPKDWQLKYEGQPWSRYKGKVIPKGAVRVNDYIIVFTGKNAVKNQNAFYEKFVDQDEFIKLRNKHSDLSNKEFFNKIMKGKKLNARGQPYTYTTVENNTYKLTDVTQDFPMDHKPRLDAIKKYFDSYKKQNGKYPSAAETKKYFSELKEKKFTVDERHIKETEKAFDIKLPQGNKSSARFKLEQDLKKLLNRKSIIDTLDAGKFPTESQIQSVLKSTKAISVYRQVDLAQYLAGNREPVVKSNLIIPKKYKKLANTAIKELGLIKEGQYGPRKKKIRMWNEKKFSKIFGLDGGMPELRASILKKIYNIIPQLKGLLGVDEIGSLSAGARTDSPYTIFGQVLGRNFNEVVKGNSIDRTKSLLEKKLINLKKNNPQRLVELEKYNQKVDDFETSANKNNPAKKVKGMKLSFEHPSKTIKNKKIYNQYKDLFDAHYEKYGYSFEIDKDSDSLIDIDKKLDTPNFKNLVKNRFKSLVGKGGKAGILAGLATLAGTGFALAATPDTEDQVPGTVVEETEIEEGGGGGGGAGYEADETGTTDQSTMKFNETTGTFVNTETGDPETQTGILDWIADNPAKSGFAALPVMYGAGAGLAKAGLPGGRYLMGWKAVIPAMMVPEKMWQYKQGMEAGEMITDPLNALWALGLGRTKENMKYYQALAKQLGVPVNQVELGLRNLKPSQWKNLPRDMKNAIMAPASKGTNLAMGTTLRKPFLKAVDALKGQAGKQGLGALAKRAGLYGAAAIAAPFAAIPAGILTAGLLGADLLYGQYKDYRDGKAIIDSMRARGKISEEDAENYLSLVKQGSLPFGLGNRIFGDEEMTLRGQVLNPEQQRQVLAGMEDQIDLFQDERQEVRALDRADDFDFFNKGGRVGFSEGNGVYDEDTQLGKRVAELMDDGYEFGEAVREAMKEGYKDGGRVGLAGGGGMDRRGFLKWLAGMAATLGAGATGLFKSGAKKGVEQVAKEVVKEAPQMLPGGVPAWFPRAVAKIKADGKLIEMADKDYVNGDIYEILLPVKEPKYDMVAGQAKQSGFETVNKRVLLEENPVSGEIEISWDVDDFDGSMKRQINFRPGESGFQKFGVDPEHPGAWEYQRVKINDPEFTYGNPDQSVPDRADFDFQDIVQDGDNVVGALENLTKTVDEKTLKEGDTAFQNKLYKDTEGEAGLLPDPEGHMTPEGWQGEGTQEIIGGEVPNWVPKDTTWHKKAKGGTVETGAIARRQSQVPPLAGPNPQGIMGLPSDVKQVRVG